MEKKDEIRELQLQVMPRIAACGTRRHSRQLDGADLVG